MSNENALVIASSTGLVDFTGLKGQARSVTPTAAIVMGGKALASLKSQAGVIAVSAAGGGRYRAAAEILADAFPKVAKGFESLCNTQPWANKNAMCTFVTAVANAPAGSKGYTKKQLAARAMLTELQAALNVNPAAQGEVVATE